MHPQPICPVPEDTARVAKAAFPKGNLYMQIRDVLGTIYDDEDFSELFEVRGRPAITPWRLALVTLMQFSEGLSDRQAAEAVRARIDWKYALGLRLSDPGFNFSVLSEFRSRLVEGGKERLLLEKLLEGCKERGYLKARGRARTDSTHVLGALRLLSKWERTAETMRAALNALAAADPEWLTEHADPEWFERYGRRVEDQRLPKGKEARTQYLNTVGADGIRLLAHLDAPYTPQVLKRLAEVEVLRQVWEQHYERIDGEVRVLDPKEMPEGARRVECCQHSFWRIPPTYVGAISFLATPARSISSALPSRTTPGRLKPQKALRRGKLPHRLGQQNGKLPPGAQEHPLVGNQDCSGAKYDPHRLLPRRLQRMPESIFVHTSQGSPTYPHPAAARRARGHPVCQKAPEDRRVCLPLFAESWYRRDGLTRSKGLRVAPCSLPRPEEDPLSGACNCDGG